MSSLARWLDRRVAAVRSLTGSLSRQFALTVSLSVAPVLAGLIVVGLLMVISGHAVVLTCAIVLGSGVLALVGSQLFSRQTLRDVEAIRAGLEAVRNGDRDVTITTAADDEIRDLAAAATGMIEQLALEEQARAQSDAARRDLVAAVSHDLRTPITSLRLLAEAIGDEIIDASQRRAYVDRMSTHVAALSALIDDLFELSRLEAGDIDWSLEQVALGELVGETVEAMRVHAEAKHIRVSTSLPDALDLARANPEKLQRVLFNLIQNAIRHTPADGSVMIHAEPTPTGIEIEVVDSGEGIEPDERERVFASFYRAGDRASRTDPGAGLGLAVARAIIEAHGGRIWIADSDVGTRVRFSLPSPVSASATI